MSHLGLVVPSGIRKGYLQNLSEYDYSLSKTVERNRETIVDVEYLYEASSQRFNLCNDNRKKPKLAIELFTDAVEQNTDMVISTMQINRHLM